MPVSRKSGSAHPDKVAEFVAQWQRELPDLPVGGMEVLGRARRLVMLSRPAIEAVFKSHGLDAGEFDVLATLRRAGSPYALRPTELFRTLMVTSGGLTDRLVRLERKGFITRAPAPEDGRSLLVQLTGQGKAVAEACIREDMAIEEAMLASLSDAERETLALLLSRLLISAEAGPSGAV